MKKLLKLFLTMFKIGLFTFGGGYAMLALLESELVEKKGWLTHEEFMDMVAIAESTPGPIAINSATYIGYKQHGFWGSFFSTLGVVTPSFIIIFTISLFFEQFLAITWVAAAFRGIQVAVVFLILSAGVKLFRPLPKNAFTLVLAVLSAAVMIAFSIFSISFSTIFYILIGGALGLILWLVASHAGKGDKA